MKKILITGAGGFIGSNLAKELAHNNELLLIDHFNDGSCFANNKRRFFGSYANLASVKGKILALDICSKEFIAALKSFNPEIIYHFAAISDTTVYDEHAILRSNLNSFYELLDYSKASGAKLVYASSASVYGRCEHACRVGRDEAPINPYAFSKLKMDEAASGHNAVGLRYFNVYGPGEFYKDSTSSMAMQWGLALLKDGRVRLFDDSAKTKRDFVYIKDVTAVNIAAADAKPGVYNVGSGKQSSFCDVLSELERALKIKAEIEWINNPYKANYQYSTLAELDEVLVCAQNMRDCAAGISDYAEHLQQLHSALHKGWLKPAWRS